MDSVYSATLALAMALAGLALVFVLSGRRVRFAAAAGWLALGLLAVSMLTHVAYGHRPGTDQALGFKAFFAEHPAFVVVGLAGVVIFGTFRRGASS